MLAVTPTARYLIRQAICTLRASQDAARVSSDPVQAEAVQRAKVLLQAAIEAGLVGGVMVLQLHGPASFVDVLTFVTDARESGLFEGAAMLEVDDQTYAALRDDLAVARRLAGLLIPDNDGELVFTKPNIRIRMRR